MARVAVIVINSVTRDARVLKEADSLQRAGHEVTVFGVKDAQNTLDHEVRESGAVIRRVGWRAAAYRRLALAFAALAAAVVAVSVPAGLVWGEGLLAAGWRMAVRAVEAGRDLLGLGYLGPLLAIIAGGLLAAWLLRKARRYLRMARRYAAIENPDELAPDAVSPRRLLNSWLGVHYKLSNWRHALSPAVLDLGPDVVHCHDILALPVGARVASRLACKLVYDAHEIYEDVAQGTPERGVVYRRIQRRYARDVDLFVTINDSILAFYREHYPALGNGIVVKNATLPTPRFTYDGRLHAVAGLPREQRIVLYQGGYATKRGLEGLVASAAFLPPTWTLVMMGWGSIEQELRTIADRVNQEGRAAPPTLDGWRADPGTAAGALPLEPGPLELGEVEPAPTHPPRPAAGEPVPPRHAGGEPVPPGHAGEGTFSDDRAGADPGPSLPAVCFVPPAPQAELPFWTAGAMVGVIPYERVGLNHWFCTPNKLWEYPNAGVPALVSPFPELSRIVVGNGTGWLLPDPLTPEGLATTIRGITDEEFTAARAACRRFIETDNWHVYERRLCEAYERMLT